LFHAKLRSAKSSHERRRRNVSADTFSSGAVFGAFWFISTDFQLAQHRNASSGKRVSGWQKGTRQSKKRWLLAMSPSLLSVLCALYASEINVSISSLWDAGWKVKLGDSVEGFKAEKDFANAELAQAANWLAEQACFFYPESNFSRSFETFGATRKQSQPMRP